MSELTSAPLKKLLAGVKARTYPKGQVLVYAGEKPDNVYILKSGVLKIFDVSKSGNEKIIHLVRPPSIFPAILFFGDVTDSSVNFYSTLTECEVYSIPQTVFRRQLAEDSQLGSYCMLWFASEMYDIMLRLSSLQRSEATDKLIAALKFLGRCYASSRSRGWLRINFPVSHQFLAQLTGVTRESITMAMRQLQDQKLVRTPQQSILEVSQKLMAG